MFGVAAISANKAAAGNRADCRVSIVIFRMVVDGAGIRSAPEAPGRPIGETSHFVRTATSRLQPFTRGDRPPPEPPMTNTGWGALLAKVRHPGRQLHRWTLAPRYKITRAPLSFANHAVASAQHSLDLCRSRIAGQRLSAIPPPAPWKGADSRFVLVAALAKIFSLTPTVKETVMRIITPGTAFLLGAATCKR